jgi:outer membrane protein, multidrug efflux system
MRNLIAVPLLTALAAFAGCASTPMPDLLAPTPDHWRHDVADAGTPTDLHGWWHVFDDPALDALVDEALAHSLVPREAMARLRAARALHGEADARFLPQLSARTEDIPDPDANASFFVAGFDAQWELDLFGRRGAAQRVARGELDAAASDVRAANVSLVAEVTRDWLALRAAQQQTQWLERIRDARARELGMLRTRERLRLVDEADVRRAEAALAQAEAAPVESQDAIDENAERLATLLGRAEPDSAWFQAAPMPSLGAWRLDTAPADLLRSRPEILRAQADVLRAAGEAGLAKAERYPNVALGGSLAWSTSLQQGPRTDGHTLASVGPIIDIPLFDWGMRAARADAKEHELEASALAYRQAVLQGVAEVETSLGRLSRQAEYEHRCADAAAAMDEASRIVVRRAEYRLADPMQASESDIAYDQAAVALVQAKESHALAFVALFKALGGAPLPVEPG